MSSRAFALDRSALAPSGVRGSVRSLLALLVAMLLALPVLLVATAQPASAAITTIAFEAPGTTGVQLGNLASRTQGKPVATSGIGPYTVRGTDSRTELPYEFVTDSDYGGLSEWTMPGWAREGLERESLSTYFISQTGQTYDGRTGVLWLASQIECTRNNLTTGVETYCSTFGPDVWTEPFDAQVGQAVSFDWAAHAVIDDYEIYAFLVRVDGEGYGTEADHTLLAYGRGTAQGWTTTSLDVPADGTYRFRFVNGSYDRSGGWALGSDLYLDTAVKVGLANPIAFDGLPDRIVGAAPFDVAATAPGGPVSFASGTPGVCTVSGTTVTLTGTTGICSVVANQPGDGVDYVAAETVTRSFRVLSEPTAPINAGLPYITGTVAEGETVTAHPGTWTDGGSPITGTAFQWVSTVDGVSTPLEGETAETCFLVASPGSELTVTVTQTNAAGSSSASSAALSGYTCAQPAAPQWADGGLGPVELGVPVEVTFTATGVLAPTYALVAGELPEGLEFDPATGSVRGTPTQPGPYEFTLRATNAAGTDDLVVSGVVGVAPGAVTGGPDAFVVGQPAGGSVSASGVPAPTYAVTAGALPPGVTLDPVTGAFLGSPTTPGTYSFTITASNGFGEPTSIELTGTVAPAPSPSVSASASPSISTTSPSPSTSPTAGDLSDTGVSPAVPALVAVLLLVVGALGLMAQRRRSALR